MKFSVSEMFWILNEKWNSVTLVNTDKSRKAEVRLLDQYWLLYVRILRLRLRASLSTALPMCPSSLLDVRPSMLPLYHSTHPARDASTSRAPAEVRSGQVTQANQHQKWPASQHASVVSYQCRPVSLRSPVLWSPAERRPPSAGRFLPPRPSARRRPEPVYSGRGRHTAPSPDSGETETEDGWKNQWCGWKGTSIITVSKIMSKVRP